MTRHLTTRCGSSSIALPSRSTRPASCRRSGGAWSGGVWSCASRPRRRLAPARPVAGRSGRWLALGRGHQPGRRLRVLRRAGALRGPARRSVPHPRRPGWRPVHRLLGQVRLPPPERPAGGRLSGPGTGGRRRPRPRCRSGSVSANAGRAWRPSMYPLALRLEADRAERAAARQAAEEVAEARRRAAPVMTELDRLAAAQPLQARYPLARVSWLAPSKLA
jgi:hypothetical protein